jgi:hypothetical protein
MKNKILVPPREKVEKGSGKGCFLYKVKAAAISSRRLCGVGPAWRLRTHTLHERSRAIVSNPHTKTPIPATPFPDSGLDPIMTPS